MIWNWPTIIQTGIQTGEVTTGIDLTNCISYFDGCNTCDVEDINEFWSCPVQALCYIQWEPKCNEYTTEDQPSKSLNTSTAIKSYENATKICWYQDWFYKNEINKINYYSWEIYQPTGVYKRNGFLYFLWRTPDSANEWTQWIHLYTYNCQNSEISDIYNFWWEIYASANLDFASDLSLYIYEYFWDSCDSLFWKSSIYNIETNSLTRFDFSSFSWFQQKPWCECTKNLDIKNSNEAYATCYCGNEGSCPESDQEQYKIKINILNKTILDKWR